MCMLCIPFNRFARYGPRQITDMQQSNTCTAVLYLKSGDDFMDLSSFLSPQIHKAHFSIFINSQHYFVKGHPSVTKKIYSFLLPGILSLWVFRVIVKNTNYIIYNLNNLPISIMASIIPL